MLFPRKSPQRSEDPRMCGKFDDHNNILPDVITV